MIKFFQSNAMKRAMEDASKEMKMYEEYIQQTKIQCACCHCTMVPVKPGDEGYDHICEECIKS